jgi:hypothetical protein
MTSFTHNEQVMMMSLWAVVSSPLMLGANLTEIQAGNDAWTTALVTNDEVIAVSQDAGGDKGRLVVRQGTTEVWAKSLAAGGTAVALFNRGEDDATVSATFAQLGITGLRNVRNLWQRMDLPQSAGSSVSATVPYHAAALLLLTAPAPPPPPSDAGAGDAGPVDAGGATGAGGAGTDGGAAGRDGGAGGAGGTGAGAAAGGSGSGGGSGCGCRTGRAGAAPAGLLCTIIVVLVAAGTHRRSRRGPRPRRARVPARRQHR